MSVPAARSDPRLRRYPLRRVRLSVATGTLDVVVPDAGAWLHTAGWAERAVRGAEPPYWADIWAAAVAVARWLCRRGGLAGVRVLDLGCGLGVPGIAAASLGAQVTFADREADALAFAAWNAARQSAAPTSVVTVAHDWHQGPLPGPFDLLLLADVTYRPVHHRPILRQIEACTSAGGVAIHADPHRRESEGFLVQAGRAFARREVELSTHWRDERHGIRLCFLGADAASLDRWIGPAVDEGKAGSRDAIPPVSATIGDRA